MISVTIENRLKFVGLKASNCGAGGGFNLQVFFPLFFLRQRNGTPELAFAMTKEHTPGFPKVLIQRLFNATLA